MRTTDGRILLGDCGTKDNINPSHYKTEGKEVSEMMIDIYGVTYFKAFCELNSFKYRMRAGKKGDNALEDIKKGLWYENKIKSSVENNDNER